MLFQELLKKSNVCKILQNTMFNTTINLLLIDLNVMLMLLTWSNLFLKLSFFRTL